MSTENESRQEAVSYTHLDVYKRQIQSLPKWIPGKQNGRNVPVYYTVPITFKLQ